ncbi:hypothetical protein HPB50_019238 [Hyalomma asiaticum]|uniref:Uncharacterized protein n=1 Tax=Hyalomma asiaticum TaxID=266040 RepID=A0ACB7S2C8_HYAAI|nr:hypothetical protein HPB50_019238 [Hyalomma asiaticum]
MQLVFILLGPVTVIAKIIIDSGSSRGAAQAFHEIDLRTYIANVTLDITHDENVWSALLASTTAAIYRVGLDQVVVQRCMASRTLGSAQSTISSIINSQAAVVYVDVLSPHFKGANAHVIMMVLSASTGPFVGLLILAIAFPFVHTKGAGISTLLLLGFQLLVMWQAIHSGAKPPLMPVSLDYCPDNSTLFESSSNVTTLLPTSERSHESSDPFQLSPFWSCLFSTCGTVVLGVLISVATGEHKQRKADVAHVNKWFIHLWRKLGFVEYDIKELGKQKSKNTSVSQNEWVDSRNSPWN